MNNFNTITSLSHNDINLIKGLGIFLIVLHNLFTQISPEIPILEFEFFDDSLSRYISLVATSPERLVESLFTFWGHYGVELFIFASAYGLTKSNDKKTKKFSSFLMKRFSQLYISFVICILFYLFIGLGRELLLNDQYIFWDALLWKLLLISNFIPGQALEPVGPWWFIPFIFQVYLLLPIIWWLAKKLGNKALLLIATVGYIIEALNPESIGHINFTPFGHLPLLCLGIYFAQNIKSQIKISSYTFIIALALFVAAHFNYYLWILSDVFITTVMMLLIFRFIQYSDKDSLIQKPFHFFGNISLHLFLVNGFVRVPFIRLSVYFDSWWGNIIMAFLGTLFCIVTAILLQHIERRARSLTLMLAQL